MSDSWSDNHADVLKAIGDGMQGKNASAELVRLQEEFRSVYLQKTTADKIVSTDPEIGTVTENDLQPDVQNKWSYVLSGIPPKMFDVKYVNTFERDNEFLEAIDKQSVSQDLWTNQEGLMKIVSKVHDSAHLVNSCAALRAACETEYGPDSFKNLIAAQMLRYFMIEYHTEGEGGEPFEPYIWGGGLDSVHRHNLTPKIVVTLINACVFELSIVRDGLFPPRVFHELLLYLVANPLIKGKKLKSIIELHQLSLFSLSTNGVFPKWDKVNMNEARPSLEKYELGVCDPNENDSMWYRLSTDGLKNERKELALEGLFELGEFLDKMLKADIVPDNMKVASALYGMTHLTGFNRTNSPISHFGQMSEKGNGEVAIHDFELRKEWRNATRWATAAEPDGGGGFMSGEQWKRSVPNFLTSKSAGGYKVVFEVPQGNGNGRFSYNFRLTDKRSVYLGNPGLATAFEAVTFKYRFYDKDGKVVSDEEVLTMEGKTSEEIEKWMEDRGIDTSEALTIAERVVTGGKGSRGINPRVLGHHASEIFMFEKLDSYMNRKDEKYAAFGTNWDWTLNGATGSDMFDHAKGIAATCYAEIYNSAQDFSRFDGTQHDSNTRTPARESVQQEIALAGMDTPITLPSLDPKKKSVTMERGWYDMIGSTWGPGSVVNTHVISRNGVSVRVILADILGSGEFMTLMYNNLSNRANFTTSYDEMAKSGLFRKMRIAALQIVGDDRNLIMIVNDLTDEDLMEFLEINAKVAALGQFELNTQKSVTRRDFYEYLKVLYIKGYRVPIPSIQLFEKENRPDIQDVIQEGRAYAQLCLIVSTRIGMDGLLNKLAMYRWLIRSEYRIRDRESRKKYYLYAGAYWSADGVGQVPFTLAANSKGAYIAYVAMNGNEELKLMNEKTSYILDFKSNLARNLANDIVEGRTFITDPKTKRKTRKDVFEAGKRELRDNVMTPERIAASKRAKEVLEESYDLKVPDELDFQQYDKNQVKAAIMANKNITVQAIKDTSTSGRVFLERAIQTKELGKRKFIRNEYKYLAGFHVMFHDKEVDYNVPVLNGKPLYFSPRVDEKLSDIVCRVGVGGTRSLRKLNPATFIAMLTRLDPTGPRRLVTEEALLDIISQASIDRDEVALDLLFQVMGYNSAASAAVANEIIRNMDRFAIVDSVFGFGFSDKLFESMSRNPENVARVVREEVIHPDPKVSNLYAEAGFFIAIMEAIRVGMLREVTLTQNDNFLEMVDAGLKKKPLRAQARRFQTGFLSTEDLRLNLHDLTMT